MNGVPGQKGVPVEGYNGVAGRNGGSVGNSSFCVSGNSTISKCVDITEVAIGNVFHEGPCGRGENNWAEYARGFSS